LDTVHKLSEDVAILKSDNASLKTQISQLNCKVDKPQGSMSSSVGFRADTVTADSAKAAHHRNPARSYAAVAVSCSAHIATPSQESAYREPPLDAWPAVPLFRPPLEVSNMQVDPDGFTTVGNKKMPTKGTSTANTSSRQPLTGVRNSALLPTVSRQVRSKGLFVSRFSPELSAYGIEKSLKKQLSLKKLVCTRFKTKFNTYAFFHV
jgi:hypothetical protein